MTRSPEGALHGQGRRSIAVLAAALLWAAQPAGTASAISCIAEVWGTVDDVRLLEQMGGEG